MRTSITKPTIPKSDAEFEMELRESCLQEGIGLMQTVQKHFQVFARNTADVAALQELFRAVHTLAGNAGVSGLQTIWQVASALESLLRELGEKPGRTTPSVLRTMAQTIDLLAGLLHHPLSRQQDQLPAIAVLALDDEEIALRAIRHSLAKVNVDPTCVQHQMQALSLAGEKQFDLIVSDIEMPGIKGLEVCTRLRAMPGYQKVPVVFVTSSSSFEHRAKACLSGGNDLIAKPFLFSELAVKALTLVVRSRIVG